MSLIQITTTQTLLLFAVPFQKDSAIYKKTMVRSVHGFLTHQYEIFMHAFCGHHQKEFKPWLIGYTDLFAKIESDQVQANTLSVLINTIKNHKSTPSKRTTFAQPQPSAKIPLTLLEAKPSTVPLDFTRHSFPRCLCLLFTPRRDVLSQPTSSSTLTEAQYL